jgi:hydroxylamine reductase
LLTEDVEEIRIGPPLPAFLSAGVTEMLVEEFGIQPIESVESDRAALLTQMGASAAD